MRVEIETLDASKQAQHVNGMIDLDRCRSPVVGYGRTQAKAVFDRHPEPGQQRSRESAESLAWGNAGVAMVPVLGDLPVFSFLSRRVRGFPDVMVGTDEDQMIGTIKEAPDRLDFGVSRRLTGSEGVEADDHDGVGVGNQRIVQRCFGSIVAHAFDLDDGIAGQCFGLFGESGEIRLLDMVEETPDTLIDVVAARQALKLLIEEPAQLEHRGKATVNHGEWRACFCRATPGEIE
ncbi:MAG: hypothetical protein ABSC06_08800 [Rhodopila sp.]